MAFPPIETRQQFRSAQAAAGRIGRAAMLVRQYGTDADAPICERLDELSSEMWQASFEAEPRLYHAGHNQT